MTTARAAALEAAISSEFAEDELTAGGKPKVEAVNARMPEGSEPVTAAERDEAFEMWSQSEPAETPQTEPAPAGSVRVRLDRSMANPLTLYIHGRGMFRMRVGDEQTIPTEALDALRGTDAQFIILE